MNRLAVRTALCALALLPLGCSSPGNDQTPVEAPDAEADGATLPDATSDATLDATLDAPAVPEAGPDVVVDAPKDVAEEPIQDAGPAMDSSVDAGDCPVDSSGEYTDLRCTGLYADFAARTIASNVQIYDPGLHLWSDGAVKTRYVYLPPGQKIDTTNIDEWVFPVGTKFWKQFVVNGVLVETRLLHKMAAFNWYMTTYRWSADQATATEFTTGATNVNDAGYEIPSQDKCTPCHQGRVDAVLGFEAVSLSSPGASGLPMSQLVSKSLLTNPPASAITIPGNAVEVAALGYLHANCGTTCHNGNRGLAHNTGFFMRLNVGQLGSVGATDTYTTGVGVATSGFHTVSTRVAKCDTASSCVYYRMARRDGVNASTGTQMPPIDTHQVDPAGLSAIAAWIDEGCAADASADH